jgi:Tol biopolymer transport system component
MRGAVASVALIAIVAGCGGTSAPQTRVAARDWQAFREGVTSPDGAHVAFLSSRGGTTSIAVADAHGAGVVKVYASQDSCCSHLSWAASGLLVFADDYTVKTVDVGSGNVRRIAGFSDFALSPDGRWLAGYAFKNGHGAEPIAVVSIDGARCLVPQQRARSTWPTYFSADGKRVVFTDANPPYTELSEALDALRPATSACSQP